MSHHRSGLMNPSGSTNTVALSHFVDIEQEFAGIKEDERGSNTIVYNPRHHLPLEQQRKQLPVYSYYREFLFAIHVSRVTIVLGDTGTGKSTQLPQYLKEAKWSSKDRLILVVVPVRIAAISLATRVAQECGCELGKEVGYATAEQSLYQDSTEIRYITDGVFLQWIQFDPLLLNVGVVILDDCHQRRLEGDLILTLLKKVQNQRPYLRIIIASATLDTEFFVQFFSSKTSDKKLRDLKNMILTEKEHKFRSRWTNVSDRKHNSSAMKPLPFKTPEVLLDVSIFRISGRLFPIHVKYLQTPCGSYLKAAFHVVLHIHKTAADLDSILVFLCGKEDIEVLMQQLNEAKDSGYTSTAYLKNLDVCPLYGSLPVNVQLEAFRAPTPGHRKVILSTQVAESSITINRVGYVVDNGFAKMSCYDEKNNMDILAIVPISKQAAIQRAGRAGRLQAGVCYRLYTEASFEHEMPDCSVPECLRTDLSFMILYFLSLGIDNVLTQVDLPFPVSSESLIAGFSKLHALEAVNDLGQLTDNYGTKMAELIPLDPLLSRFLVYSTQAPVPCSYEATVIAAMMMCGNPWVVPNPKSRLKPKLLEACMRSIGVREGDLVTLYNIYKQAEFYKSEDPNWEARHMINSKVLKRAESIQHRLEKKLASWDVTLVSVQDDVVSLQKAICASFFINAAYRYSDGSYKRFGYHPKSTQGSSKSQDSLTIHPSSLTNPHQPLFVVFHRALMIHHVHQVDDHAYMINVTPIEPRWLTEVAGNYFQLHFPDYSSSKT